MEPKWTRLLPLALIALGACASQRQQAPDTPSPRPAVHPAPSPAPSPAPEEPDVDPYFRDAPSITSETGPRVITRNVLQDREGEYWLATWNGLVRYDGTTFTNVTKKEGLRPYRVFCLLEDHRGHIWVGTTGAGVYRYDGKTYTNFTTKDGLVGGSVVSMMQDSDNNIWFGAAGVTKYDGQTFTSFTEEDGFTNADVNSISQGPDGSMWFGTRGALFHYDGEEFVDFTEKHRANIHGNSYIPTLIDGSGHLWFGGQTGLHHYDGETLQHVFASPTFSLLEDSDRRIWFSGGALEGEAPKPGTVVLNRFDPKAGLENLLTARDRVEVPTGAVFGLTEDEEGTIWFGTGRGIGRIDGGVVRFY